MRVIAGEARGQPLRAPKGSATRPTADKVKGAIFSMIESLLLRSGDEALVESGEGVWAGKRVLDLYAGSGALAIEALSRGAACADLVDGERAACQAAQANLAATKLADRARVHCQPVRQALKTLAQAGEPCDIILADPPYADPTIAETIATVAESPLVGSRSLLVVEHARNVSLADRYGSMTRVRERRHGGTVASIWLGPDRLAALGGASEPAEEGIEA